MSNLNELAVVLYCSRFLDLETLKTLQLVSKYYEKAFDIVRIFRVAFYDRHCNHFQQHWRKWYWYKAAKVFQCQKSSQSKRPFKKGSSSLYEQLLLGNGNIQHGLSGLDLSGIEGEIQRDVVRTFCNSELFSSQDGKGLDMLSNILYSSAILNPDVGYCQGMNYTAGSFLLALNDTKEKNTEEISFWLLTSLLDKYSFRQLWIAGMPLLKIRTYQLDCLVAKSFPRLRSHLRTIGLGIDFFATQWFMTLFSKTMPLNILVQVWDSFFLVGWKLVFRVALAILSLIEKDLCEMDLEQASVYFRKNPKMGLDELSSSELMSIAFQFKVTRSLLVTLEKDHHIQTLHARLRGGSTQCGISVPETDKFIKIDRIKSELDGMDVTIADDYAVIKEKIEQCEKQIAESRQHYYAISWKLFGITSSVDEFQEKKENLVKQFHNHIVCQAPFVSSFQNATTTHENHHNREVLGEEEKPKVVNDHVVDRGYLNQLEKCPRRLSNDRVVNVTSSTMETPTTFDHHGSDDGYPPTSHSTVSGRFMVCFDRISRLSSVVYGGNSILPHLDGFINPEFHTYQSKIEAVERQLYEAKQEQLEARKSYLNVQVELEEYIELKNRLAEQLFLLITRNNERKTERMTQLFEEMDLENTSLTTICNLGI